jgi:integrase
MTTFKNVSEAWIVSREHCTGSLGRIQFWVDQFGSTPITDITEDDVDRALEALVARGKVKPGRNGQPATPTGEPLAVTKNGRPHIAPLTDRCLAELLRLRKGQPAERVFKSYLNDKPFNYRTLWGKVCKEAGYEGRTFHWLRHGCGSALASAGIAQAQIMQVMGHRTLIASARYIHSNVDDRRDVVGRVFS